MSLSRFKELEPVSVDIQKKLSSDYQYWNALQFPITIQEFGAVTNVDFQQSKPNYFVVTASNRLEVYDPENNELVKSFTRFPKTVYGATFRSDGKLIVAGGEDTRVRLFDVQGQAALRTFRGHSRPVYVTKFINQTQVFSAGDDKIVRIWDVATEECVTRLDGHEDYIRCGYSSITSNNLIFTGSYDHTVRMYDTRTNTSSMVINHGCPVESVLVYPSGSVLLTAGGNAIKVWDILQGGKHLATVSHHHKTITCMCFNHDCTRLMSGSLDRHVKIYDVATYGVVHNINYPAAILSLAISSEDKTLVVGMIDKMLSIRHRKSASIEKETIAAKRSRQRTKYLMGAGETYIPNSSDITISHERKKRMKKYDIYFRKFQHSKALDEALHNRLWVNHPEVSVAIMEELIRRDTLHAALAGRAGRHLTRLLQFILRMAGEAMLEQLGISGKSKARAFSEHRVTNKVAVATRSANHCHMFKFFALLLQTIWLYLVVCELHFHPHEILRTTSTFDEKNGKTVK